MWQRGLPNHLIKACQSLYQNTRMLIDSEEVPTNQGIKQGCYLSPTLFNIYNDDIMQEWKHAINTGIKFNISSFINMLLFGDDQMIIQTNANDLQKATYKLYKICQKYNMIISIAKTKTMAFRRKEPVRTKIIIHDKVIEQVPHFTYNIIFYYDLDIQKRLYRFKYLWHAEENS